MRQRWPDLHCIRQLADGEPLTGTWYDRTQQHHARRKGEDDDPAQHATTETVTFSPLPCWKHLSPEAYRERVAKMGLEIEEEAAAIRKRTGAKPFGAAAILAQDPWTRPERVKKSPAPLLHAASKAMRQVFYEGYASSLPPTARPPRSSREEIPTRASRWGASRRRCRSSAGRTR
jgi:hypothetical protein